MHTHIPRCLSNAASIHHGTHLLEVIGENVTIIFKHLVEALKDIVPYHCTKFRESFRISRVCLSRARFRVHVKQDVEDPTKRRALLGRMLPHDVKDLGLPQGMTHLVETEATQPDCITQGHCRVRHRDYHIPIGIHVCSLGTRNESHVVVHAHS